MTHNEFLTFLKENQGKYFCFGYTKLLNENTNTEDDSIPMIARYDSETRIQFDYNVNLDQYDFTFKQIPRIFTDNEFLKWLSEWAEFPEDQIKEMYLCDNEIECDLFHPIGEDCPLKIKDKTK